MTNFVLPCKETRRLHVRPKLTLTVRLEDRDMVDGNLELSVKQRRVMLQVL